MAFYLARHVAHTTDVDGMLAAMTPQQFNEWLAVLMCWGILGSEEASDEHSLATFKQLAGF